MNLEPYQFRSPARLIAQIATDTPLVRDTAYVVLVAHPSTEQRIVAIRRLDTPAMIGDWQDARDEMHDVVRDLPIPEEPRPPTHSVVTVLVRPGYCVFGPHEGSWMEAWKFSNHFANAFNGGVILVTEHGWSDFMTDTAGHTPAMAA
jgi:hypothetical protein